MLSLLRFCRPRLTYNVGNQMKMSKHMLHTTPPSMAVPPAVLFFLRYIAKGIAFIAGRNVRTWWRNLPKQRREEYWVRIKEKKWKIAGSGVATGFVGHYFYTSHLEGTPITGRERFLIVSSKMIEELSQIEFQAIMQEYAGRIVFTKHPVYARVAIVANRLLSANKHLPQIYTKNWTITVLDDPANVNAFVLPNGNIFVFTGMLNQCASDDELGVILGHEMAHCILGHAAENVSREHWVEGLKVMLMGIVSLILPTAVTSYLGYAFGSEAVETAFSYPYGRLMETEADEVGLQLAAKACFDVRAAVAFWSKMHLLEELKHGGAEPIEWLSTHPSHKSRQEKLEEQIPFALQIREYCKCPRLPQKDPRQEVEEFRQALLRKRHKVGDPVGVRLVVPNIVDVAHGTR